jgi:hypothetical protein
MTESTPGGVFSGTNAFASVDPTTGNVTGIAAGVTDVTYMVTTTNCDITKPVTVDPLPATIVTGTGTVCQGATITFTDPDPSGTWTSLNTSIASVGIVSGIITGTGAGSTSIIYTLPTGCTNSTTVAVNASPVSLVTASGPTTFCAGDSVLLTGSSGAGDIYQWNLAGVPIPGATTTSYTANATGAFTFSMTNALNCTTNSAVLNVVDGITGTIVNGTPLAFCQGYTALLYASTGSVSGSIDYQWQLNDVSIAGATDSSYAAPSAGEYKCLITITGGAGSCAVVSDSVALTVYSPPSPAISYNGHVLSTAGGFAGYQWYENTISIPGATNAVYLPVSNGTFKVRVTNSNDCSAFATDYDLTNVGVNEVNNQTEILISPNPATSSLHIESSVIVDASITDLEGKTVMTQLAAKEINITNLASGMYFIILSDQQGNRIEVDKFIKE